MIGDDYKMYQNERFDHLTHLINAQFSVVNERLDKIEVQTTRTNGRVTELEKCQENMKGQEIGKRTQLAKYLQVGGFVIAIIMGLFAYMNLNNQNQTINKKIDYMSSPMVFRGGHVNDTIK